MAADGPDAGGAILDPNEKDAGLGGCGVDAVDVEAGADVVLELNENGFEASADFLSDAVDWVVLDCPKENDEVEDEAGAPNGFDLVGDFGGSLELVEVAAGADGFPNANGAGAADDPDVDDGVDD